jgi:hypothetical protein
MSIENDIGRLTKTAYRVLDFLPENDPLKVKAKEKALAVLENLIIFPGSESQEKLVNQVSGDIEVLINYLEIGKDQGWINSANFLIFEKEYRQIKQHIQSFVLPTKLIDRPKESNSVQRHNNASVIKNRSGSIKSEGGPLSKALARQTKILEILGQQEKAQVSDFIRELPRITKRTVRRDLDELLRGGKIVRNGAWNQVFYQILK